MDLLKPEYNILQIAGSSLGYRHTEENLCKISAAMQGVGVGISKSDETRAKMSAPKMGNYGGITPNATLQLQKLQF
jgi:hypothetical protein